VTEEIEAIVDVALGQVLDPESTLTEVGKHRWDVILNEMDGPNRDIAEVNLKWIKDGCPPLPPEPPPTPEPVVFVTPEIQELAQKALDRSDYYYFA
jgi:hypothetical protein